MHYKSTLLLFLLGMLSAPVFATKHTITNSGNRFSPATINAVVGDEVEFKLTNDHNAVEVSKSTWDAGGSASNGGFQLPFGGGSITLTKAGTFYYVCEPHAELGMKGSITVTGSSAAFDPELARLDWTVAPNPMHSQAYISIHFERSAAAQWNLSDVLGRSIRTSQFELKPGDNTLPLDAESAPPGIYMLQLWIDGRPAPAKKLRID
jgi:plastocyanin